MAIPRERKVLVGVGAIAISGLMFDKVFLGPDDAAASTPQAAEAALVSPVQAVTAAVATRVEGGIRDAMMRAMKDHVQEGTPELAFGLDAIISAQAVPEPDSTASQPETPGARSQAQGGFLGLSKQPNLTLVMPTRDGGIAVIDGHRLRVGQTHPDGYRLERVQERVAVLSRDGMTANLVLPTPGN